MFFFKTKPFLPEELVQWQFETFGWLLRHTGGIESFASTVLVLPTDEFFPDKGLRGSKGVERLFLRVREYAGMEQWPCELHEQDPDPSARIADFVMVQGEPSSAAGTFSHSAEADAVPVITYNRNITGNPMALVATFAHELAHYLCGTFPEGAPGGEEMHEHATDLTAVFLGFGIFLSNSAFHFQQYSEAGSQGWQSNIQGYMSETELVFALAVFCNLRGFAWRDVAPHLESHLRPLLKKAAEVLEEREAALSALKARA
jgi:hypothetical protein